MRDLQLRQEIIACTSEMFRKAGARDLTDGFNTAASLFENLAAQLRQLDTEEKFEAVLDKLPEPGKTERTGIRAALRFGPHLFRYAISRLASEARNEFPKPPGGRSHTFGPRRRVDVCRFITEKYEAGTDLHIAKKRAAARFNTSLRTIERVWTARRKKAVLPPTFQDALRFFREPNQA